MCGKRMEALPPTPRAHTHFSKGNEAVAETRMKGSELYPVIFDLARSFGYHQCFNPIRAIFAMLHPMLGLTNQNTPQGLFGL